MKIFSIKSQGNISFKNSQPLKEKETTVDASANTSNNPVKYYEERHTGKQPLETEKGKKEFFLKRLFKKIFGKNKKNKLEVKV